MIEIVRKWWYKDATVGELFIDGRRFCYTLEDTARAWGVKIPGWTCIPPGDYKVKLTFSGRFQMTLPVVYTVDGEPPYILRNGGVEFKGVRFHAGNTHHHTDGCILLGYNRYDDQIQDKQAVEDIIPKIANHPELRIKHNFDSLHS